MSCVLLIAADKPLPLCDRQEERTKSVKIPECVQSPGIRGKEFSITHVCGFMVAKHTYYRHATDELGYPIKPYQYELSLEVHETDLGHLKAYLRKHFAPGEEVELWNLWVGIDNNGPPPHCRGTLADFDMELLEQLVKPPLREGCPGQCRMTITI